MKHLTYDERLQIQKALTLKCSFIEIASKVGKDRTPPLVAKSGRMRNMSASPPEANVNSNVSLKIKRNVLLRDAQKESAQLPVLDVRNTVTGMSRRLAKS